MNPVLWSVCFEPTGQEIINNCDLNVIRLK